MIVRISLLEADPGDTGGGTLHRALRRDVLFPFAAIGVGDEYEVVREQGTVDIHGGTLLIAPYEVPDGADDEFVAAWERARAVFAGQRGHMGTRLLRASGPAEHRFVELTRWSSPLMYARALALPELPAIPFPAHGALYSG